MKCILVRHAIAEEREQWARTNRPDSERPLTERGRQRMKEAARGLFRLVPELQEIVTSPFIRAFETADILRSCYQRVDFREEPLFGCGAATIGELVELVSASRKTTAFVGHEPELSALSAHLLGSPNRDAFRFKKGGAICFSLQDEEFRFDWRVTPKILRGLGR